MNDRANGQAFGLHRCCCGGGELGAAVGAALGAAGVEHAARAAAAAVPHAILRNIRRFSLVLSTLS